MAPELLYYSLGASVTAFSTTRQGGVSEGNYGSFNINAYCGDTVFAIQRNRKLLAETLHISDDHIIMPHQVHHAVNHIIDPTFLALSADKQTAALEGIDSLTTDIPGICIGISTADCVPVLLYDPVHHASAAIHAGWRGTVQRIVEHTVQTMQTTYHTDPHDLHAVIGPCISLDAFEVGQEVYDAFAAEGFEMKKIARHYKKWHIDLPVCNWLQLEHTGVLAKNIILSGICTYNSSDRFFSARKLGQQSGRIYTGIILKK
ncbi:MAG: peptidoglycan editing factor PgeF [Prevotella sp.]|nr:peptidoglycan editing factor PgeF [Prevotella sp.]